jgi:hypothetical protein
MMVVEDVGNVGIDGVENTPRHVNPKIEFRILDGVGL